MFEDGLMFDGSSIRGFQAIHESDMALFPDPTTAYLDTFRTDKTLVVNFFIHDPLTGEAYSRDPRNIARKAQEYLKSTGIGDTAFFAPEAEFYVFDDVRFETKQNTGYYSIDSIAGAWNSGRRGGRRQPRLQGQVQGRLLPGPAVRPLRRPARRDRPRSSRSPASSSSASTTRWAPPARPRSTSGSTSCCSCADNLMKFKYIVKNVAWKNGKTATFMPKPIFGDNGSGMHCHQSVWADGEPLFYDESGYGGLCDTARYYIGGLLAHAPSLLAFTNPTVNSYHRLVPGFEAPVNLVYSQRNRSACIRIPITGANPKAKRIEFRCPDPSANPYLAFSAMLLAGLDGIKNKIEPPTADRQGPLRAAAGRARRTSQTVPASLTAVLDSLEADHEFLLEGGVFTPDLIDTWIDYKRTNEVAPDPLRPHPHEFELYYDI